MGKKGPALLKARILGKQPPPQCPPSSHTDSPTPPHCPSGPPLQPPTGLTLFFPSHVHLPTKPHAHTHTNTHAHTYLNIVSVSKGQAHGGVRALEGKEKTLKVKQGRDAGALA